MISFEDFILLYDEDFIAHECIKAIEDFEDFDTKGEIVRTIFSCVQSLSLGLFGLVI